MLPLPCMLVCTFVCANRTRDRGCSKHPVFPAPSMSKRAIEDANLGRSAPRDREIVPGAVARMSEATSGDHSNTAPDVASLIRATSNKLDSFATLVMTRIDRSVPDSSYLQVTPPL